jgi:hypothetical protein
MCNNQVCRWVSNVSPCDKTLLFWRNPAFHQILNDRECILILLILLKYSKGDFNVAHLLNCFLPKTMPVSQSIYRAHWILRGTSINQSIYLCIYIHLYIPYLCRLTPCTYWPTLLCASNSPRELLCQVLKCNSIIYSVLYVKPWPGFRHGFVAHIILEV